MLLTREISYQTKTKYMELSFLLLVVVALTTLAVIDPRYWSM